VGQVLATVLLIPLILWSTLQPMINHNTSLTKETIKIALYEISKEASLKGKFDEELYAEFKEMLEKNHGYNPDCIQIKGTEELTTRGGELTVTVTVPKPIQSIWDTVSVASCERPDSYEPFRVTHTIKSEYIP
jgi:hydrogenase maturation factor HypF (carbamoyltransferase family)